MKKLAILISNAGTGSNLQAIIDAIKTKKLYAKISVVVSDKEDAYGLIRAKKEKIPLHIFHAKEENMIELLTVVYPADYVILAGWKKIIPNDFITAFDKKILNIHPGLIPDDSDGLVKNPDGSNGLWNKGKFANKAIAGFLNAHATYAGSTIHFLSHEFDFGKVLLRGFEKIRPIDTLESLYARLKIEENQMIVQSLQLLCNKT